MFLLTPEHRARPTLRDLARPPVRRRPSNRKAHVSCMTLRFIDRFFGLPPNTHLADAPPGHIHDFQLQMLVADLVAGQGHFAQFTVNESA